MISSVPYQFIPGEEIFPASLSPARNE